MSERYEIKIQGLDDVVDFVDTWSSHYTYKLEEKYKNNINNGLDSKEAFVELFKWKNGTPKKISNSKMKTVERFWRKIGVLRKLQRIYQTNEHFDWDTFENELKPHKKAPIWALFVLHIINPNRFPIFDQHVYRAYKFFKEGIIKELPSSPTNIYHIYRGSYHDWFTNLYYQHNTDPKKMDEAFFTYGRMLKSLKKYPVEITDNE